MTLQWQEQHNMSANGTTSGVSTENTLYHASCFEDIDKNVRSAIDESIAKAISLLPLNINDNSRYLLFEWDESTLTLSIIVTDDLKENDSSYTVQCRMTKLAVNMNELHEHSESEWQQKTAEYTDNVKYWITDYLTTSGPFLQYSLIAIFHSSCRKNAIML